MLERAARASRRTAQSFGLFGVDEFNLHERWQIAVSLQVNALRWLAAGAIEDRVGSGHGHTLILGAHELHEPLKGRLPVPLRQIADLALELRSATGIARLALLEPARACCAPVLSHRATTVCRVAFGERDPIRAASSDRRPGTPPVICLPSETVVATR